MLLKILLLNFWEDLKIISLISPYMVKLQVVYMQRE